MIFGGGGVTMVSVSISNAMSNQWNHCNHFPDGLLWADELHTVHLLWRVQEPMCSLQLLLWPRVLLQGAFLYLYLYLYMYFICICICACFCTCIFICRTVWVVQHGPGLLPVWESSRFVIINIFVWCHHQHLCLASSAILIWHHHPCHNHHIVLLCITNDHHITFILRIIIILSPSSSASSWWNPGAKSDKSETSATGPEPSHKVFPISLCLSFSFSVSHFPFFCPSNFQIFPLLLSLSF